MEDRVGNRRRRPDDADFAQALNAERRDLRILFVPSVDATGPSLR